jgi:hypothetical protein
VEQTRAKLEERANAHSILPSAFAFLGNVNRSLRGRASAPQQRQEISCCLLP